jgi:cytochrome c556
MRLSILIAAVSIALVGCGGSDTNQASTAETANSVKATPTKAQSALAAASSQDEARRIMHERHEGMEAIGKANKSIKRELESAQPDLAVVHASAAKIANLSRKASGWFPRGSGPELGKTGAKHDIWQNPDDFLGKLHDFQAKAKAFDAAAGGNDLALIRSRSGDLSGACKACHDKYRSEMHH